MSEPTNSMRRRRRMIAVATLLLVVVAVACFLKYRADNQARELAEGNLRVCLFAMRGFSDYEGRGKMVPQAICDKHGNPLLSWRVALLPYIEQKSLYDQFKLDEPWDSPHNIRLLKFMPPLYRSTRRDAGDGGTYLQAVTGVGTAFPEPPTAKRPRLRDCRDGILVMEAAAAVPWTKPEDVHIDPSAPLPSFGGDFGAGLFLAGHGDGTVRLHSHSTEIDLRAQLLIGTLH